MIDKIFLILLSALPIAFLAHILNVSPVIVFFLSGLAIIPLAKFIGEASEELATRTSAAMGGLLNATFGNATEFIIGFFALQAGLIEVVKASIIGSIIGNLLLVLGCAMFAGGLHRKSQTFNRTAALASGSALFVAVIAFVIPAIFLQTQPSLSNIIVEHLSIWISVLLLGVYAAGLFFSLHTHKHLYGEESEKYVPHWSVAKSVSILIAATFAVAVMSEILVGSIEPLVASIGWSPLFIGVIFIAIIGNIAEHSAAVVVAIKDRMDLSLQISIGSATQIVMVVAPLLMLSSLLLPHHMNLVFDTFELICVVLSVLIVNLMVADGESNWLEGIQLVTAYLIMAIAFFYHT